MPILFLSSFVLKNTHVYVVLRVIRPALNLTVTMYFTVLSVHKTAEVKMYSSSVSSLKLKMFCFCRDPCLDTPLFVVQLSRVCLPSQFHLLPPFLLHTKQKARSKDAMEAFALRGYKMAPAISALKSPFGPLQNFKALLLQATVHAKDLVVEQVEMGTPM